MQERMERDSKTGRLAPTPKWSVKDEPWSAAPVYEKKVEFNLHNGGTVRFNTRKRPATDGERMERMKKVRDTITIPTTKEDLERIRGIESLRLKKKEDSSPRVFPPRRPEMPELPVRIPRP